MADTIVLLLMGDSAITLRPVSGVPLSSETVKGILNLVKMGDRLLAKP
jgi:phosphoribosylcarboxyaminoimidazole (NCAIR) mutase